MKDIDTEITEYLNYCKNVRRMSPVTLLNKEKILQKFARETKIYNLTYLTDDVFNNWIKSKFLQKISTSSLNIYNSTILSLVKFYQNAGVKIPLNLNNIPHFKTKRSKRRFYTEKEIKKVLNFASAEESLMIKILIETGLRISEFTGLKVENFHENRIEFIGKGQKLREVYIRSETYEDLRKYLKEYKIQNGYIWCVVNGTKTLNSAPLTVQTLRKILQKVFEKAGIPGFYPHALRHSFATNLQKKGASVIEIKEMMGHSSVSTTERYLHGFDGQLEKLFNKYW